jgi:hypothetical protein
MTVSDGSNREGPMNTRSFTPSSPASARPESPKPEGPEVESAGESELDTVQAESERERAAGGVTDRRGDVDRRKGTRVSGGDEDVESSRVQDDPSKMRER